MLGYGRLVRCRDREIPPTAPLELGKESLSIKGMGNDCDRDPYPMSEFPPAVSRLTFHIPYCRLGMSCYFDFD